MITQDDIIALGKAAKLAGFNIDINQIQLITWNMGIDTHVPRALPNGRSAVYIFKHNDIYLKVGQAGPGSNPRYQTQHYNPNSCNSNLAKSLLNHATYRVTVPRYEPKFWIRNNTDRFNILIPTNLHPQIQYFVNFVEAFFILKCFPLFER